jgi:hypothetical protein
VNYYQSTLISYHSYSSVIKIKPLSSDKVVEESDVMFSIVANHPSQPIIVRFLLFRRKCKHVAYVDGHANHFDSVLDVRQ